MKHSFLTAFTVALGLFFLSPAPQASARVRSVKVNASGAKITAVSATSISVQTAKTTQTYKISAATLIHMDGRKASASELQKGMRANVTASQLDPGAAASIEASSGN
jgi:outer membrane receptor protein involved in Fe transport